MQDLLATSAVADVDAVDGDHAAPVEPFRKIGISEPSRTSRTRSRHQSRFRVITETGNTAAAAWTGYVAAACVATDPTDAAETRNR